MIDAGTPSRTPRDLRRIGPALCRHVASWTGEHAYTVSQVLKDMVSRCRELDLRLGRAPTDVKLETAILLTMQITSHLHSTGYRLAL